MKRFANRVLRHLGLQVVRIDSLPWDFSEADRRIWTFVRPFTQTSPERVRAVVQAVRYLERYRIGGDVVECGVWKGGSMMAMARSLLELGSTSRTLWLFDTFEGMSPPTEHDVDAWGRPAQAYLDRGPRFNAASLAEVREHMKLAGYPDERVRYVEGRVEETVPREAPDRIALLRLDTDWYQSTRHALENLFPRVVPCGIVIIDDYGHWLGARKAVDEYLERCEVPCFLARIDYTGRMVLKPR